MLFPLYTMYLPDDFGCFRINSENHQLQQLFPTLDTFFHYVENQWIRGMPFSFWNVYQRASLLRTTNLCEGWNSNCKHRLGNSSRNIWGVIMDLKKKNEIKKVNLEKSEEENPRSPKGENIEMLIQEFEDSKTRSKTI